MEIGGTFLSMRLSGLQSEFERWLVLLCATLSLLLTSLYSAPAGAAVETIDAENFYEVSAYCNQQVPTLESARACVGANIVDFHPSCQTLGLTTINPDASYIRFQCYNNGPNDPPTVYDMHTFAAARARCPAGYQVTNAPSGYAVDATCTINVVVNDQTAKTAAKECVENPIYPGSCTKIQSEVDYRDPADGSLRPRGKTEQLLSLVCGLQRVVPLTMKVGALDVHCSKLIISDFYAGRVSSAVQLGADLQT